MTALEKRLLTSQIIILHHMRESFRVCCNKIGINNARYDFLEYEECKLIDTIQECLEDFGVSDKQLDSIIDDIRNQLKVGNYINIINIIENWEPKK